MDRTAELEKLDELKSRGLINDTEFATQKEKLQNLSYGPAEAPSVNFDFDGSAGSYLGVNILSSLLTVCTLGIALPWAYCMRERWKAEHTLIKGKRLKFVGQGGNLFGKWIVWELLCVVTLGIYSFWVGPNLMKWKWQNTRFA